MRRNIYKSSEIRPKNLNEIQLRKPYIGNSNVTLSPPNFCDIS